MIESSSDPGSAMRSRSDAYPSGTTSANNSNNSDTRAPNLLVWVYSFYGFTKSTLWLFFLFVFSILLMFGPAIQSLADAGRRGDAAFLYLRIVMLFFFTVDILVRCFAEEGYFLLTLCRHRIICHNWISAPTQSNTTNGDSKEPFISIGSFLFWCDLLSTLSILYDLSFVNNHHFDPIYYEINAIRGIPVSFGVAACLKKI
jgi:hypothetical protein